MKILKVHLVEIAIAALFILWGCFSYAGSAEKPIKPEAVPYNNDWACIVGGSRTEYGQLPESIRISKGSDEIVLSKSLDNAILHDNAIGFYSSHQYITAFLDGEEIYQFQVPEGIRSKTPGNCWNFIRLQKDYAGRLLEIHIRNAYPSEHVQVPDFILGIKSDIMIRQIQEKSAALIASIAFLLAGLMLGGSWLSFGKKMHFSEGIQWIALFSIQFSIWSTLESRIPIILFGKEILFGQLTCISLKLMLMPILCFIQVFFQMEEKRTFHLLAQLTALDFAVSFVGQLFGWFDYPQTMWITYTLALLTVAAALFYGIQLLIKRSYRLLADRQRAILNMIGILLAAGCIIVDAWNNYFHHSSIDGAVFSRFGCLAFVLIQAFWFRRDSVRLIAAGQESENSQEETEIDRLTTLKNRRAFKATLRQAKPERYPEYSFVLFDLNHLKKINDAYGHEMGDCYIITSSEVMQDIFGEFGEIFRIGGDEFCLMSDRLTQEVYDALEKRMNSWIENLQGVQVKDFKIASGYAAFNKSKDINLQDTVERADRIMYQKKKEQKNRKLGGS